MTVLVLLSLNIFIPVNSGFIIDDPEHEDNTQDLLTLRLLQVEMYLIMILQL